MRMGRPFFFVIFAARRAGEAENLGYAFSAHKERSGGGGRTLGVEDL